jgi:hypothetical protein
MLGPMLVLTKLTSDRSTSGNFGAVRAGPVFRDFANGDCPPPGRWRAATDSLAGCFALKPMDNRVTGLSRGSCTCACCSTQRW